VPGNLVHDESVFLVAEYDVLEATMGKRGGLRVIYYWWEAGSQFWLFTVYDKDEMADLTPLQRQAFKEMIKKELKARRKR